MIAIASNSIECAVGIQPLRKFNCLIITPTQRIDLALLMSSRNAVYQFADELMADMPLDQYTVQVQPA